MRSLIDIKHLSKAEKLRMMEAIWEELSANDQEVESPDWHQKALQETEHRLSAGQEKVVDWQTAKKKLRNLFE